MTQNSEPLAPRNLKITPEILTNHAGPCQLQVLRVLTTETGYS